MNAAIAPLTSQRARVSGRREDLLEAAAGLVRRPLRDERRGCEPGGDEEQLDEDLEEAGGRVRSKPGNTVAGPSGGSRRRRAAGDIGPTSEASSAPIDPGPRPHQIARGSWSPNARLVGPRTPSTAAGSEGSADPERHPEIPPREELHADREEHDADDPDERERRPVELPDERDVVLHPSERAQDGQRPDVEAVHGPREREGDAGDAGRAGPAEERGERECEPAEEQGGEPEPQREADGPSGRIGSPSAASPKVFELTVIIDGHERQGEDEHRQVRGDLLDRDPALAEGRRGDEVEAAATRLAGKRRRQPEDRPQRGANTKTRPYFQVR